MLTDGAWRSSYTCAEEPPTLAVRCKEWRATALAKSHPVELGTVGSWLAARRARGPSACRKPDLARDDVPLVYRKLAPSLVDMRRNLRLSHDFARERAEYRVAHPRKHSTEKRSNHCTDRQVWVIAVLLRHRWIKCSAGSYVGDGSPRCDCQRTMRPERRGEDRYGMHGL